MKNKDIHEWLLDEGIDPLTTVTTEKGEYYLSDILEKHLTEQLRLFAVSRRTFKAFDNGLEKIEATAETMEEAIQIAFDIFGERTLLWTFRWVD